ncbi:DsbA family protein [Mesobaculum littorinae]|uniref:DsbA family protein n=2 Tax=Mesobaculum littorinae TaxID=2486419 RepID=A0A438AHS6_9RHOB|nr:DsbA family protein [Mesobaculum littorinae]
MAASAQATETDTGTGTETEAGAETGTPGSTEMGASDTGVTDTGASDQDSTDSETGAEEAAEGEEAADTGAETAAETATDTAADADTGSAPKVVEMTMGDADAPVTVVEYASFTCPHCAHFHQDVLPQIKANYIDSGDVRFVFREVYFDRFGLWAGMVARCGGEERYFGIADVIFERQREWTRGQPAEIAANLRRIGKTAGMDEATLDACLQDAEMAEALVARFEETSQEDGIDATPSFIINGEKFSNMGYDAFAETLDEQIEAAQ